VIAKTSLLDASVNHIKHTATSPLKPALAHKLSWNETKFTSAIIDKTGIIAARKLVVQNVILEIVVSRYP
jgi:hypothetical protein